ncbi:50S ribosomal protein L10 [endosymbiont of Sipalinus gigas]|uniref:50S ribosomal protein L10 n=1 Tax=endosymbiont of Sipalinus gigas TaxID=1972134 RepID=UPI000DC6D7A4|nr:50S ribosomal protein L10 [endosymbiont of Sipalinus gigas]BBA85273.1 50S ribosomal protein L10 [endosymbiont of Sipalinus gigas]
MIKIDKKKIIVNKISILLNKSTSISLINLNNIKTNDINNLRKIFYKNNIGIFIIKNNMLNIALNESPFSFLKNKIKNSNIILLSYNIDFNLPLKIFYEYKKNIEYIKLICFNGKIYEGDNIKYICNILTYKELLNKLIFILKEKSILNLYNILKKLLKIKSNQEL